MKSGVLILIFFVFTFAGKAQHTGKFTDPRDGTEYHWVKVGGQTWMANNLRFTVPGHSWIYNEDDTVHLPKYGMLYDWDGARQACPKGWVLPSSKEWRKLISALGEEQAGKILQSWDTTGVPGRNGFPPVLPAFSSLLSGVRYPDGRCLNVTFWGACWSSTSVNDSTAANFLFARKTASAGESTNDKQTGFSVRCIKK